jgi:FkbM family methyltransferase
VTKRQSLSAFTQGPHGVLARASLHYMQRLGRWSVILVEMRGHTLIDELKLVTSALAAPITSLRGLLSWQDPILLFDTSVRVLGIGRFDVRKKTDDLWHVLPWREREIHRVLRSRLTPGRTFVDAGANIGVYTILASRLVGETGRVIAIEMIPATAKVLRHHLDINGCRNVVVVEKALSDRAGIIVTATVPRGSFGQASIARRREHSQLDRIDVETVTLDIVCVDVAAIDLIKMDLEGAESLALAGAGATLAKVQEVIFETVQEGTDEASHRLQKSGFSVLSLSPKDKLARRIER